jgi:AMMECR1 domain-containing protein
MVFGSPASALALADFQTPEVQSVVTRLTRTAILNPMDASVMALDLPGPLRSPAGVFVTISRGGVTRGCWGTVSPREATVADELAAVARRVRVADWRARPIHPSEWSSLQAYVSILGPVQPVNSLGAWSPRQFGLWVTAPGRGAAVLPGEAATLNWQLAECRRKAGLSARTPVRLYRFETAVIGPISLAP